MLYWNILFDIKTRKMISIEYVPVDVQIETEILHTVMGQT